MKRALIRLFIMPSGVVLLLGISLLSLILIFLPEPNQSQQVKQEREEFPNQRRGGGTHWDSTPPHVA